MKAAFNILPEKNEPGPVHLLIEAGAYGISFIWFRKDPLVITGLAVYNFIHKILPAGMALEIENILRSNAVFNELTVSTTICYDFNDSILIPGDHYKPATALEMLNLVHNQTSLVDLKTDRITSNDIFNVYAVDKKITSVLSGKFPGATTYHSVSLLLEKMNVTGTYLHCIVYHNSIKVFLFNEGLQFAGQFFYIKPVDAAYHLLNCCSQYGIDPSRLQLQLSGMIDEHSNLYNELYKYFLAIDFEHPAAGITMHERIQFYPPHFFSHLITLVSCVS